MGAAIVNDDGAINVIPFGAPAIKDVPNDDDDDDDDTEL